MDGIEEPVGVSSVGGRGFDPEGLGEIGEGEIGVGGDRRSRKGPLECSSRKEHASYSKDERNGDLHDKLRYNYKKDSNDVYNKSGDSEGFHMSPECKKLQRKSTKRPNGSPCRKRPRTDQIESNDKSRPQKDLKHKFVQDGKRCERKNCRSMGKAKSDSFMWKNGSSSDHFNLGNNIIGIHGNKLDSHDCTKDMDEPSLTELLDGNYDSRNLCQSKGKKVSFGNENIALSIGKVCCILPIQGHKTSCSKGVPLNAQSINSSTIVAETSGIDNVMEEPMLFSKASSDHTTDIFCQQQLHHPSYILERLALPTGQDLGSLFRGLNLASPDSVHSASNAPNVCDMGLPPFSWPSNGSCRPSADNGKLAMNRQPGQGRWVRIGSRNINGESPDCFREPVHKMVNLVVSSVQKELDELFQDAKTLTMSYSLPLQQNVKSSDEVIDNPHANLVDDGKHKNVSAAFKIGNLFDPSLSNSRDKSLDGCFGCEMKELPDKGMETKGSLWYNKNGSGAVDPSSAIFTFRAGGVASQEDVSREIYGHLRKNDTSCRSGKDRCSLRQWHPSPAETSKEGHSPRAVAAAEILQEMSRHPEANRKQNRPTEKIRSPNLPAQMAMKARQPKPPVKMEESLQETKSTFPRKPFKVPSSSLHKPVPGDKKSKLPCAKNAGRESLRWPSTVETLCTPKLDRDSPTYTKPSFLVDMIVPPPRSEKGRDDHHYRWRKETTLPPSTKSFGVKDWRFWSRGRSRRE